MTDTICTMHQKHLMRVNSNKTDKGVNNKMFVKIDNMLGFLV